jgi:hypothetical protein
MFYQRKELLLLEKNNFQLHPCRMDRMSLHQTAQQIMSLCIVTGEGTWRIYHTFETTVQSLLGCLFSNRPIMVSPISKSLTRPCAIDTASVFRDSSPLIKFLSLLDLLLDFPMKNEQDCDALESLSKVLFDKKNPAHDYPK